MFNQFLRKCSLLSLGNINGGLTLNCWYLSQASISWVEFVRGSHQWLLSVIPSLPGISVTSVTFQLAVPKDPDTLTDSTPVESNLALCFIKIQTLKYTGADVAQCGGGMHDCYEEQKGTGSESQSTRLDWTRFWQRASTLRQKQETLSMVRNS
jgi:hypothetical protein